MNTIIAILILVFGLFAIVYFHSRQIARSADQQLFIAGAVPNPLPDGLYKGSAAGYKGSWQGKKFDAANKSGINLFGDKEVYPFSMWVGAGLTDKNIDVLKIDYNIPSNPFWLRPVLDEVVQIQPGVLLGKLQLRLIPGLPLSILFFRLTK